MFRKLYPNRSGLTEATDPLADDRSPLPASGSARPAADAAHPSRDIADLTRLHQAATQVASFPDAGQAKAEARQRAAVAEQLKQSHKKTQRDGGKGTDSSSERVDASDASDASDGSTTNTKRSGKKAISSTNRKTAEDSSERVTASGESTSSSTRCGDSDEGTASDADASTERASPSQPRKAPRVSSVRADGSDGTASDAGDTEQPPERTFDQLQAKMRALKRKQDRAKLQKNVKETTRLEREIKTLQKKLEKVTRTREEDDGAGVFGIDDDDHRKDRQKPSVSRATPGAASPKAGTGTSVRPQALTGTVSPTAASAATSAATINASPASPSASVSASVQRVRESLEPSIKSLEELRRIRREQASTNIDGDEAELDADDKELLALQQDIDKLSDVLQHFIGRTSLGSARASNPASVVASHAETVITTTTNVTTTTTTSSTTATVTTTTTRVGATPTAQVAASDAEAERLAALHRSVRASARRSSFMVTEDLRTQFAKFELEEIEKIEEQIIEQLFLADQYSAEKIKLTAQLKASGSESSSGKEARRLSRQLKKCEANFLKHMNAVGKLVTKLEAHIDKLLPRKTVEEVKKQEQDLQQLVDSCKSKKTRELEETHKKMLRDHTEAINQSPWSNTCWNAAAGIAGFTASFGFSNTLWRCLPMGISPLIPGIGAPLLAGTAHVIFATPIVKQLMSQTWSSNALNDLNNHFKLRGAAWADWWLGETDEKKYFSKDPNKLEKITITERMAEEPAFKDLFHRRYRDEEASYFFYSLNYALKGVVSTVMAPFFVPETDTGRRTDAAMHFVAGAISAAEYVIGQQHARSQRVIPDKDGNPVRAKPTAVPTRAIYAAEAAALQSLVDDINHRLTVLQADPNKNPTDRTERDLTKALNRTKKALLIATTKSKPLGTLNHEFWAQFSNETVADTISEVLGRILSLITVSGVTYATDTWRKSMDPLLMFLGHALPAIVLILPPGFTSRPLLTGLIRGLIQAFLNERAKTPPTGHVPLREVKVGDESEVVEGDDSSTVIDSLGGDWERSEHGLRRPAAEDESVIVSASEDDDVWRGNPTQRDLERGSW